MAVISMKQLLEAGVHFGHQTRRWNPKMAPYIFTERNGIYIIDLQKTVKLIDVAYDFVREVAAEGKDILFVGTKKQAQEAIQEEALRANMHFVNNRWLGGMLTNFGTIKKRIARMEEIRVMQEDGTFEEVFNGLGVLIYNKMLCHLPNERKHNYRLSVKKLKELNNDTENDKIKLLKL